ncbi:YdaS family helix-turn-helix protein [Paraburkholderia sp. BL21I4N1]|uniref:YdaS family helix-turn-helix protein n=1 Tax=Paraburkholderia sp. BL21I4N1 TaxID=1938801 RepID=UPI000CFDC58A|nr:YdaS family helix-turn-helix protein [Paraburkholderia sp. BL21I4N1]PQV51848.1 YdaS antitoxin of YdaST toxin-antitoxin system [Paraburkholderia sp. BL21I4N1]
MTVIKAAIERAGGAASVARALNISRISVYEWIADNKLPERGSRALALAELTDWEYTPHMLAPTLYPNPTDGLPSLMSG